jgi:hypothetical protein
MPEGRARHSLEFPPELWLRLDRLRRRDELATLDAAVTAAIHAGYDALTNEDRRPSPVSDGAMSRSRSSAARLLVETGLAALGVPEHPASNGA